MAVIASLPLTPSAQAEKVEAAPTIPCPQDHIYDPENILTPDTRTKLSEIFARARAEVGCELFLFSMPSPPPEGAETMSRRLGNAWAKYEYWAIFYQVGTGSSTKLGVVAGGRNMLNATSGGLLEKANERAARHASVTPSKQGKIYTYCRELANELTFVPKKQKRQILDFEAQKKPSLLGMLTKLPMRTWLILCALVIIPCLAYFLIIHKNHRPITLPEVEWRSRLQGLYSGGGNAVISFRANIPPKNTP